ncbi:YjgB family protein [Shimazuella sp. AN120528]|uniref:YjgB family protein n=1 Tax=Shimazuella soli TaxID=1892854 RepID=UPI001F0ED13C|nr:YjgB family protein [Shimazuella soli]MCH5584911.1 YjgB family protein [Shimazuella soli]
MKSIKLTIITILGLLILNGCTINVPSSKSNSTNPTSSSSDTNSTDQNTSSNTDSSVNIEHRNYLQQSYDLANEGKVIGSEFAANKNDIESVEDKYGQPDTPDNTYAYYIYKSRNLSFHVGKGDILDDVRSYDPYLHNITRSEVKKVLGEPTHIRKLKGQSIYVYHANGYEFKLIFLLTKDDPTIDHISVYSPDAAFNPMAN